MPLLNGKAGVAEGFDVGFAGLLIAGTAGRIAGDHPHETMRTPLDDLDVNVDGLQFLDVFIKNKKAIVVGRDPEADKGSAIAEIDPMPELAIALERRMLGDVQGGIEGAKHGVVHAGTQAEHLRLPRLLA